MYSTLVKGAAVLVLVWLGLTASVPNATAQSSSPETSHKSSWWDRWFGEDRLDWGGHLKNRVTLSLPSDDGLLTAGETDPLWDEQAELRLKAAYHVTPDITLEVHNETYYLASGTKRALSFLGGSASAYPGVGLNDDRRLLDLTWNIEEDRDELWLTRFDRLFCTLDYSDGYLRVGRQAITWGHGLLFNPMDVFSPFAPTTLDRDYKQGEDAVLFEHRLGESLGDVTLLQVFRRDPDSEDAEWSQFSLAGKYHTFIPGTQTEVTCIAGKHFEDLVFGAGLVGYLGGAACRLDATLTRLQGGDTFSSMTANLDYAWMWWGKNLYGWVEVYYNGLGQGRKDYEDAWNRESVRERLDRGELFVRGRWYLDTQVRIELHPLVNLYVNTITNVLDPSGIVQPYITWDVTQNVGLHLAGTFYWGAEETEYGGVPVPGTQWTDKPPTTLYSWVAWYF